MGSFFEFFMSLTQLGHFGPFWWKYILISLEDCGVSKIDSAGEGTNAMGTSSALRWFQKWVVQRWGTHQSNSIGFWMILL